MKEVTCSFCGSAEYRHDLDGDYFRFIKLHCLHCRSTFIVKFDVFMHTRDVNARTYYEDGNEELFEGFSDYYDFLDYYYRLYYDDDFNGDMEDYCYDNSLLTKIDKKL